MQAVFTDESGSIRCLWFGRATWVARWTEGQQVIISGRVTPRAQLAMLHPEVEELDDDRDPVLPVYRLTAGLSQRRLRGLIRRALAELPNPTPSLMSASEGSQFGFPSLGDALRVCHFPATMEDGFRARDRVRVEALIPFQVLVARRRSLFREGRAPAMTRSVPALVSFLRTLPFALTTAQTEALAEIRRDLALPHPMHRLLQGDVGSGKTVVALGAAVVTLGHGFQALLMVPTEVLADQHRRVLTPWLDLIGYPVRVLTGSTPSKEREEISSMLAAGQPLLLVGTHALLEESVNVGRAGLVVIDEQHRFGLAQRATLASKGGSPHVLVMTATPIPRSLAMTLYGHLDLSVIAEKPPGRKPTRTVWFEHHHRARAWDMLRQTVGQGIQAYVVAPLVEESQRLEARGAVELHQELSNEVFPDVPTGLVHGRMKGMQKDLVIQQFRAGALRVLVCTTVVEVGLDVPGAGVLLVDGAERFGLAQLHQLRGRIGRGGQDALCVLLTGEDITDDAQRRVRAMVETDDGFALAELDLGLRGPGAMLGPAQHGKLAGLLTADPRLAVIARQCADHIIAHGAPPGIDLEAVLTQLSRDEPALGAG